MTRLQSRAEACGVPAAAARLVSLDRVDYADAFTVELPAGAGLDAEGWLRAGFEGLGQAAAGRSRRFARIWWLLIGGRLHPVLSPDRVFGWRVGRRGPGAIRIDAHLWWGGAQIVCLILPSSPGREKLILSTFMTHQGWAGRAFFSSVGRLAIRPAHRRVTSFALARLSRTARRPGAVAHRGRTVAPRKS